MHSVSTNFSEAIVCFTIPSEAQNIAQKYSSSALVHESTWNTASQQVSGSSLLRLVHKEVDHYLSTVAAKNLQVENECLVFSDIQLRVVPFLRRSKQDSNAQSSVVIYMITDFFVFADLTVSETHTDSRRGDVITADNHLYLPIEKVFTAREDILLNKKGVGKSVSTTLPIIVVILDDGDFGTVRERQSFDAIVDFQKNCLNYPEMVIPSRFFSELCHFSRKEEEENDVGQASEASYLDSGLGRTVKDGILFFSSSHFLLHSFFWERWCEIGDFLLPIAEVGTEKLEIPVDSEHKDLSSLRVGQKRSRYPDYSSISLSPSFVDKEYWIAKVRSLQNAVDTGDDRSSAPYWWVKDIVKLFSFPRPLWEFCPVKVANLLESSGKTTDLSVLKSSQKTLSLETKLLEKVSEADLFSTTWSFESYTSVNSSESTKFSNNFMQCSKNQRVSSFEKISLKCAQGWAKSFLKRSLKNSKFQDNSSSKALESYRLYLLAEVLRRKKDQLAHILLLDNSESISKVSHRSTEARPLIDAFWTEVANEVSNLNFHQKQHESTIVNGKVFSWNGKEAEKMYITHFGGELRQTPCDCSSYFPNLNSPGLWESHIAFLLHFFLTFFSAEGVSEKNFSSTISDEKVYSSNSFALQPHKEPFESSCFTECNNATFHELKCYSLFLSENIVAMQSAFIERLNALPKCNPNVSL